MNNYRNWFRYYIKKLRYHQCVKLTLFLLLGLVMFISMYSNFQSEILNLTLFSKAEKDILSPVTVEDPEATRKKRQEALTKVEDQYVLKTDYAEGRVDLVAAVFDAVLSVKKQLPKANIDEVSIQDQLNLLNEKVPKDIQDHFTAKVFTPLLKASEDQLDTAKSTTITTVRQAMKRKIRVGEEDEQKLKVAKELNNVNVHSELRNAMKSIAQYAIIPNYVYDQMETEQKRQQVLDNITPVTIRAGQVLAKEGQIIDREIYRQLNLTGLLDKKQNFSTFFGLALFILLMLSILAYYFEEVKSPVRSQNTYLFIYVIILMLTIVLMKVISLFQQFYSEIGLVMPIAVATMLIKMLINDRMAILTTFIVAFCGTIIFNNEVLGNFNYLIGLYLFFSSMAGVMFLSKQNQRTKILKVGLAVALVNMLVLITLSLLMNSQYSTLEMVFYLTLAILSGISSSILTLGLMPVFEAGFGMLSTMKLIELANPNHPLLRKILTETPGTYHHSIMVANLAEAACEAIGADGFLARVGSYYHDLGKTKRPHFYIENQMNMENPHNKIAPQLSKTIITAHPYDGAELLREFKLPKEIIGIAEEHHGTTLLKYFYHKAKQADSRVTESDFRYPGPKAQTKESAIVGVADSVEAAVRSMQNPTPNKIEALVRNIIADRLQDGQFDECDLTLKELDIAAQSMCETLNGIFHSRIEYPEIIKKKVKEA